MYVFVEGVWGVWRVVSMCACGCGCGGRGILVIEKGDLDYVIIQPKIF